MTKREPRRARPEVMGHNARSILYKPRSANPFPVGSEDHQKWLDGYNRADAAANKETDRQDAIFHGDADPEPGDDDEDEEESDDEV